MRHTALAITCAAALAATGCFTYRGPRDLQAILAEQAGDSLEREFGLSMGPIATKIAGGVLHLSGEGDFSLKGVYRVRVVVYARPDGNRKAARPIDLDRCARSGWETVVRVRDGSDQVLIQARAAGDVIRDLAILSADGDEVVYVGLHGRLDHAVEALLRDAVGREGARRFKGSLTASVRSGS